MLSELIFAMPVADSKSTPDSHLSAKPKELNTTVLQFSKSLVVRAKRKLDSENTKQDSETSAASNHKKSRTSQVSPTIEYKGVHLTEPPSEDNVHPDTVLIATIRFEDAIRGEIRRQREVPRSLGMITPTLKQIKESLGMRKAIKRGYADYYCVLYEEARVSHPVEAGMWWAEYVTDRSIQY